MTNPWQWLNERREAQAYARAQSQLALARVAERERLAFEAEVRAAQQEAAESDYQLAQYSLLLTQVKAQQTMAAEILGKNVFNDSDAGTLFDLYNYATADAIGESDHQTMQRNAYQAWATDAYAHGWIEVFVKFVVGMSCRLRHADGDETAQDILDEFMRGYEHPDMGREKPWELRANEWVRRSFRDGETFVRKYPRDDGRWYLRFMCPLYFRSPNSGTPETLFGILTKKDDIEWPLTYYYWPMQVLLGPQFTPEAIPARYMIHTKLGDSDAKRGRPLLLPVIADLVEFNKLLRARRKLHWLRTLYAVQRKLIGTAAAFAAAKHEKDRVKASASYDPTGATERAPKSPSIQEHGENVEYDFKTPNLQAQDADEDLKWHGSKILTGLGLTPQVGFAGAISQTYSEGELSESPMITTMKMWQGFFGWDFIRLGESVLVEARRHGRLDQSTSTEVAIDWPIINPRDVEKETRALALQRTMDWVDDRSAISKLGNDPDAVMEGLEIDRKRRVANGENNGTDLLGLTDAEMAASLAGSAGRNGKGNPDKVGLVPKSIKRVVSGNGNGNRARA